MLKILIVDDEDIIRAGLQSLIDKNIPDYQVVGTARNGKEGLALALKLIPHVIIADIKMPYLDGLEMVDMIRPTLHDVKFIILSAYTDFPYLQHAIRSGVVDYLEKPVNRFELANRLNTIRNILNHEEAIQQAIQKDTKAELSAPPPENFSGVKENATVDKAIQYVHANFFTDISLTVISKYLHINSNYFCTLFKKKTGVNFIDYLTSVRIENSKKLLENPNLKIYEISQMIGYYSSKHFSLLFKDLVGVTPTEYREALNKQYQK